MTVLAFVIGIVLLVVGLAISIALHEVGHLVPAKSFGVRVGQYMVGFGPTLWSRRKGETEYGLKAIPLGGYISMAGMYPPSPRAAGAEAAAAQRGGRAGGGFFATMVQDARSANDETLADDDSRTFYRLPVYKRVIIMLGGPVMNFLLAIVIYAILLSGIGVQTATTTVGALSECVPQPAATSCAADDPVPPAVTAGLQPGDHIVSIDGTAVGEFADASDIIRASAGKTLSLVVERDGRQRTVSLTPVAVETTQTDAAGSPVVGADGSPVLAEVGFAGIRPTAEYRRQPIWAGPEAAVQNVGAVAGIIWQMPVKVWDAGASLITGAERDPSGPLSIVGAAGLAGEVAAADAPILNRVAVFLQLLASLNIALFVFNLIPLLPLDGGHVVIALWDGLKRVWAKLFRRSAPKPVDATRLVPATFVVVVLLIVMGGVLILADLLNPITLT